MNINFESIKIYLHNEFQFAVVKGGELCGHAIKALNQGLMHLRKSALLAGNQGLANIRHDVRLAGATVVVSNLAFIEIAYLVASLADRGMKGVFGPNKNWSENGITTNAVFVTGIATSTLIGLNVVLYKGLKIPLTPALTLAISITTCASYVLARLCYANAKEA